MRQPPPDEYRGRRGHHERGREQRPGRPQPVPGQQPVQPEHQPVGTLGAVPAHLHLAVVEVGGPGLVLAVFEGLAQRPVHDAEPFR